MVKRIIHIVGARPNFMKISPIMKEMSKYPGEFEQLLIHTGQHYDESMSEIFLKELGLPEPDMNLDVGSGSHAFQTAKIVERIEPVLLKNKPDWIFVPGDVNSTLACALVASKLGIRIAHIEAGLRSFDRTMPEEVNRVLTDHLSDVLFTTEDSANLNLKSEGINEKKIYFVGNTMIDSLVRFLPIAESRWKEIKKRIGSEEYILVTIHRPSNVDFKNILSEILKALAMINKRMPVIFPAHPRTLRNITGYNLNTIADGIHICEPVGYLDFLALEKHALLVITDSGGVQEETTFLGIPCLTVRPNSERPSTILLGTNQLVGKKTEQLYAACMMLLDTSRQKGSPQKRPPLWDGKAARRIVSVMTDSR